MSIYKFINHSNPKINILLKKIIDLHPTEINLSLNRINILLNKLNNPQHKLPFTIHIAGTNGKGSVATSMYQLQKLYGKKVHVYRSPHLISINERIVVANKMISNKFLYESLKYVYEVNKFSSITFFEFLTATAYHIFSKIKADLLVCEVGLGGTYDATNIISNKNKACIITPIDLDHKEYLGNSIKKIAFEKAGILKKNNTLICSNQNKQALTVIKKVSLMKNCKAFFYGKDWYIKNHSLYIRGKKEISLSNLSLEGDHQYKNIGCVILTCLLLQELDIDKKNISRFLGKIKWEGRLHKLKGNIKKNNSSVDFWVDCAHNRLGFETLRSWVLKNKISNLIIILAIGVAKDYKGILKVIKKMDPKLLMVLKETTFNSRSSEDILLEANHLNIKCRASKDIDEVGKLLSIKNSYSKNFKTCLFTGSINFVGEIIKLDCKKN